MTRTLHNAAKDNQTLFKKMKYLHIPFVDEVMPTEHLQQQQNKFTRRKPKGASE